MPWSPHILSISGRSGFKLLVRPRRTASCSLKKRGRLCGLVWCKLSASEPVLADIYQMWVAPSARGLRAGFALLDTAVQWAKSRQAACVRLGVTLTNEAAVRLYESYGFVPSGEPEPLREGSSLMSQTLVLDLAD